MELRRSTLRLLAVVLLTLLPALHALSAATTQPATPLDLFHAHLAALADLKNLHLQFTCRRDLAGIDTPLNCSGTLWIRAGTRKPGTTLIASGAAGGAVHIRTAQPYSSETILLDGRFIGRSQHETRWQVSDQAARPGLAALMGQIAGWCIGDPGKLTDWFTVAQTAATADQPETFTLSPRTADLQKSIHTIALRFEPHSHQLLWVRLTTAQDDQSTYEFSDQQANVQFPSDIFRYDSR
jgi:hypothetical protein